MQIVLFIRMQDFNPQVLVAISSSKVDREFLIPGRVILLKRKRSNESHWTRIVKLYEDSLLLCLNWQY